jgi:hypothetical protein
MTIAVALKVNDGIVLAADSASTIMGASPGDVVNVYNNANKIFNLRKGLPVGLMTWGLGSIDGASISTLAKDLRRRFTDPLPDHQSWHLDKAAYTIEEVAERVKTFFYDERYKPEADEAPVDDENEFPTLGFIVAGYSPAQPQAEEYLLVMSKDGCEGPTPLNPGVQTGVSWAGQPEAISRLVNGYGLDIGAVLIDDLGLDPSNLDEAVGVLAGRLSAPLVNPAMPFQDAIDLAEFLVHVSIQWSRFMPGSPTVGGPIETAAISKHEGYKWVHRKHYFDAKLNPEAI